MNLIEKIEKVSNLLEDEWSRKIFENRICFSYTIASSGRSKGGVEDGFNFYKTSCIPEIESRFDSNREYLIAGAGKLGCKTAKALRHAGYEVIGFLDNNQTKYGKTLEGITIYSYEWLYEKKDSVIVIANPRYGRDFYRQVKAYRYPEENILYCLDGDLLTKFGNEYFDVPVHEIGKNEIFIDAGCLDGEDSKRFIEWCGGEYKKIIAVEPSKRSERIVRNSLSDYQVEVLNVALGEKDGEIEFYDIYDHPGGSGINEKENAFRYKMPIKRIDDIAGNQHITFIKMDIEGSEIAALKGTENIIKRDKPILAVSVYHNEDDVVDIPLLISGMREDYKFYLRHYSNTLCDLVLYCI